GIAFDHYTALLQFDPNNPILSNWLTFIQEFSSQGPSITNQPLGQCSPAQLNTANLHEAPEPLDANPNNLNDTLDSADNQEALCANKIQNRLWINVPEETQKKQQKEGACILCATLLCTMVFAPDNLSAHFPSHSSTTLLLHTTLPFSNNSVPTLVNSGTTDNFVDKSLAALTPQHLQCLPTPILLKLFNSNPTPARDITHCLETTMIFTNG
ncbi:hypothetical protein C0989_002041, partial [Termitomyces sp. Mn162]